jgi:hypothetical protein
MDNYIQEGQTITQNSDLSVLWTIGWIFTIGYLKLSFWKGVLAIIIWPYYLGAEFSKNKKTQNEHN